ncbi:4-hydroxythreonine-4-phosphate dehydrogenase PdxA [Verrucomicrobium sp. BvORR106]|uniref:4-hydroxythreonine-4-phosphate dehydrogenase PdxA n=1 Tax=Verrucomicrobium sp. BvORR106 TaxID=1403819 RepID=UPI000571ED0A|nr:4-hydroxythreonine-4-phosphate dehydrogenase PdxA [Verrucomicrobium sp. BvORR106]
MPSKPIIALTMGDPAGVGPEVCLQLLANQEVTTQCSPVIFGSAAILERVSQATGFPLPDTVIPREAWKRTHSNLDVPAILDLGEIDAASVTPGVIGAHTGAAAYAYVNLAINAALAGEIAGVATGPLNKEAMHMAGIHFPGHTEIFASRTASDRWCMMQYSEEITCTFVTVHCGYAEVPALLTQKRIQEVIELTAEALQRIRGRAPKIVVCGLNPHAGEHGLFGDREEERIIIPAIEAARAQGLDVEGPLPPDTAFLPWKRRSTDAFVCMYHDQGHIPVKALAFDNAVNTTLGLPVIRTSVDHGTALDIAWQGKANAGSMSHAVKLAVKLSRQRETQGSTPRQAE